MPRTIAIYDENEDGLTPDQLLAAELLSQPGRGGYTMAQIAEFASTSERSILRWRRDPRFSEYVRKRTMQQVSEHLPEIMETLTARAKEGRSIRAIETWLKAQGLLRPEMIVRPMPQEDVRTNDAIERDIEELRRQLDELEEK